MNDLLTSIITLALRISATAEAVQPFAPRSDTLNVTGLTIPELRPQISS
jgi:hypothetical protein